MKPIVANIPAAKQTGIKQEPKVKLIHAMGQYIDFENGEDCHAKYLLDMYGLSAHFLIDPSGVIIQCLDIEMMGAHAKGHNRGTVGIEFLVPGLHTLATLYDAIKTGWVTKAAFEAGVELCAWLDLEGVTEWGRHDCLDPARKKDPGEGFPYDRLQSATKLRVEQLSC